MERNLSVYGENEIVILIILIEIEIIILCKFYYLIRV